MDARTLGRIYVAVVQTVMLYGSEMWVLTSRIGSFLGRLHHRVTQRLTGRQPWQERYGVWVYPPLDSAIAEATLQDLKTYVYRRQNRVAQFIATRPIMELWLAEEHIPGSRMT